MTPFSAGLGTEVPNGSSKDDDVTTHIQSGYPSKWQRSKAPKKSKTSWSNSILKAAWPRERQLAKAPPPLPAKILDLQKNGLNRCAAAGRLSGSAPSPRKSQRPKEKYHYAGPCPVTADELWGGAVIPWITWIVLPSYWQNDCTVVPSDSNRNVKRKNWPLIQHSMSHWIW